MSLPCPYHALARHPIRPDAPMGSPVDADRRWDELRESFSQPGTKPWDRMLQIGGELLTDVGKDTNVMSYVGLALFQVRGYAGLAEALSCWTDLLGERWDQIWPERAIRRKAGPLRFSQVISDWVKASPPRDEVPAEVLRRCLEGLTAFEAAAAARLGEDAAPMDGLREALEEAVRATPTPDPPAQPAHEAAATTAQDAAPAPPVPPASANVASAPPPAPAPTPTPTPPPTPTLTPTPTPTPTPATSAAPMADRVKLPEGASPGQVADALRQVRADVLALVERARSAQPGDPAAYRIGRSWAWMLAELPARDDQAPARTRLEFVHQQTADKLQRLVASGAWDETLSVAEKIWPRSLFWLDPHRATSLALSSLGHEEAARAVEDCVLTLVRRLPELPRLQFADQTPLASADTQLWLTTLGERGAARAAPMEQTITAVNARPSPTSPEPLPSDGSEEEALALAATALGAGRPREAAALIEAHIRGLSSGRAVFRARVRFAHLLLDAGQGQAVGPLLAALDEEASAHQLDRWEPDLVAELVRALMRSRSRPPTKPQPPEAEALRSRAARLGAFTLLFEL